MNGGEFPKIDYWHGIDILSVNKNIKAEITKLFPQIFSPLQLKKKVHYHLFSSVVLMKVFLSMFLTTWEKIKNGGYEHQRNDYSCLCQSTGRRFTQTAKAYPIEPINMGLSLEMNFGAQIILKHIQNHPGHIYNIPCKTAQTFPTQSLNHLCHVVKK